MPLVAIVGKPSACPDHVSCACLMRTVLLPAAETVRMLITRFSEEAEQGKGDELQLHYVNENACEGVVVPPMMMSRTASGRYLYDIRR